MLRVLPLLFLILAGCSTTSSSRATSDRAAWTAAQERWERMRPLNYDYRVSRSCLCRVTDYAVAVRNGRVDSMTALTGGAPSATDAYGEVAGPGPFGPTIDDLFAALDAAIAAGVEIEAAYHPRHGFPTLARPDVAAEAVDGSAANTVYAFEVR